MQDLALRNEQWCLQHSRTLAYAIVPALRALQEAVLTGAEGLLLHSSKTTVKSKEFPSSCLAIMCHLLMSEMQTAHVIIQLSVTSSAICRCSRHAIPGTTTTLASFNSSKMSMEFSTCFNLTHKNMPARGACHSAYFDSCFSAQVK